MSQRKYSLEEIDAMRVAVRNIYRDDPTLPANTMFNSVEEDALVEERLRTYMQNGTEPEELTRRAAEASWNPWQTYSAPVYSR